jgi:flavin-dependent dehydrogenase
VTSSRSGVDVDVLVVGGGPVGLGTALLCRAAGLSVVVVERRPDPVDKACGEGLMPSALRALGGLGVDPPGVPFRGIRYVGASGRPAATARFPAGEAGRGVRRTALVAALAERAGRAGVERVRGTFRGLEDQGDRVVSGGIAARWLIGADGLHSAVRTAIGQQTLTRAPARFGLRRHFAVAPWADVVEVHWGPGAEAYVTPVGPHEVGVALLTDRRGSGHDELLAGFPALRSRLDGAPATTPVLGAGPLEQRVAGRRRGRVLLVGDAAGYVDALTGEGVALGLASARECVRCLALGRPEDYEAAWRAVSRRYRVLTRGVLFAARHEVLRGAVVPVAAALPRTFGTVVRALG